MISHDPVPRTDRNHAPYRTGQIAKFGMVKVGDRKDRGGEARKGD